MIFRIIFNVSLVLSALFATAYLFTSPVLLCLIIFGLAVIFLFWYRRTELFFMFFLGGFVGVTFEAFCIAKGVWAYQIPFIFGVPLWLFPLWGLATLVMAESEKIMIDAILKLKKR